MRNYAQCCQAITCTLWEFSEPRSSFTIRERKLRSRDINAGKSKEGGEKFKEFKRFFVGNIATFSSWPLNPTTIACVSSLLKHRNLWSSMGMSAQNGSMICSMDLIPSFASSHILLKIFAKPMKFDRSSTLTFFFAPLTNIHCNMTKKIWPLSWKLQLLITWDHTELTVHLRNTRGGIIYYSELFSRRSLLQPFKMNKIWWMVNAESLHFSISLSAVSSSSWHGAHLCRPLNDKSAVRI